MVGWAHAANAGVVDVRQRDRARLRTAHSLSRWEIADRADVSVGDVRRYEIDPDSIQSAERRARLDTVYALLVFHAPTKGPK